MKVSMKGRYETNKSNGPAVALATLGFNAGDVKLRACFHSYKRTALDGTLVLDSANKVSANHALGSRNCKLKYTYVHEGVTTFEPCYDLEKNSWEFAVARKVYGDHVLRGWYQTSSPVLGLEWSRNSKQNGSFKILASVDLAEEKKVPKLIVESTWSLEI
ncbi:hypothetical protein F2P56_012602 [Juglans regia]|uniref:Outer envelope pore protein 24, chloroplastic-like n=2 Tax=Juglans regia TaxID=51240 RepID=A0A2I4F4U1_JUGRE|nr:outer envelope pore protein 24, chloroplastic-like [Juglans regia]KAF5468452.1 hypothetical protein F2P56_012602 [Juglans regia]